MFNNGRAAYMIVPSYSAMAPLSVAWHDLGGSLILAAAKDSDCRKVQRWTDFELVEGSRQLCATGPDDGTLWKEDTLSISDGRQSLVLCQLRLGQL